MPFVYDFDHAHRKPPMEMKDLLGGKGANLAEMTSVLDLPVPPGFTIATTACRSYMEGGWPDGLTQEVAKARARLEKQMGKRIGDPGDPLLVSVRSGAKFSMPGMMDTVLNLGLNDQSVEGLAKQTDDERFAFDSYRRFVAMYGRIVLGIPGDEFDALARGGQGVGRYRLRRGRSHRAPALSGRRLPADRRTPHRQAVPPGSGRAAPRRHRGSVRVMERSSGRRLPGAGANRPRPGHCGQCAGDGVRQSGRRLGDRGGVHPRPGDRGGGRVRGLSGQRPGRGRGGRHPEHRAIVRAEAGDSRRSTRSCSPSSPGWRPTTGTCATPSSPSSRASSGCSRPGSASAPAGRLCGWPSTWWGEDHPTDPAEALSG